MRCAATLLVGLFLVGCSPKPTVDATPVKAPVAEQATAPQQPATELGMAPGSAEYAAALEKISKGDLYGAQADLRKVVQLNPKSPEAWNDLAYVAVRAEGVNSHALPPGPNRAPSTAVTAAQKALELTPGWAHAQYNLGFAFLVNGQYVAAIAPLQKSAAQQPDRPEPQVALGLALLGAGQPTEAIATCEKARADYRWTNECLMAAGKGFKRLPDTEAAIGSHKYTPGKGFSGVGGEFVRISPPFTCSLQAADGLAANYVGCKPDGGWFFVWLTRDARTGATPAGIGVGTPWADVLKTYGETVRDGHGLHYAVADLHLTVGGNEKDGVTALLFEAVSPFWVIEHWLHEK